MLILAAGLVVISASAAAALVSLRSSTAPPPVSPTWGLFDDAQWNAVAAQLPSFDARSIHLVAAMSARLALIGDGRCVALVRDAHASAPICKLDRPLLAFTLRDGRFVDVVGLARHDVTTLVITAGGIRQGGALLPAGRLNAFGFGQADAPVLEALDGRGAVVEKLYCASALRGVCGMSAQRRS